jgi:hypothetical protein
MDIIEMPLKFAEDLDKKGWVIWILIGLILFFIYLVVKFK